MSNKPHHDAEPEAIRKAEDKSEFIFGPRAFNIVWGNDSRYWRVPAPRLPVSPDNNNEAAELVQVSWLEVTGSVQLKESTSYKISFTLSFKGDAFGWSNCPVFMMAKVGKKGKYKWKKLKELENPSKDTKEVPSPNDDFVVEVPKDSLDTRLYFGLYEVWSGKWKGGLRIHNAMVKEIKQSNTK